MSANVGTIDDIGAMDNTGAIAGESKHPKGLYVLFGTEMWERFSFYSMLALFTLYLRDPAQGFGWTATQATSLYANYLMFVYASPLIGGLIADKITGYRKAVMIGGVFFMIGHGLLSIPALWAVYAALTCLVIGNGFFKPNVSTMVGNLYPEGSHLKDRAYNIFYMGINVGAMFAPIVMEIVKAYFGFHAAFAVAAFGMLISVGILWFFKNSVEGTEKNPLRSPDQAADAAATAVDAPPHG
ncbi:MAG: MFS transporter, partial [Acidobacteria bacterium]|nr:MFS transporter [Acidobacteriota bacterium]